MSAPRLSVIVPVYNAESALGRCLEAIAGQEGLAGEAELIVVDDGSRDGSAAAAAGRCDRLLRLPQNHGAAFARNRGAEQAGAELLVFVDADVILAPDALRRLREVFDREPGIAAAVGRYTERPAAPGLVSLFHNAFTRYHHDLAPPEIDWFWGALAAVRKDAFTAAGGFDERYRGASAEDIELGRVMARAGGRIVYCPEAEGAHAHHFNLRTMLANDYKKAVLGMKLKLAGRMPTRAPGFASGPNLATALILALAILLGLMCLVLQPLAAAAGLGLVGVTAAVLLLAVNRRYYQYLSGLAPERRACLVLLHWLQVLVIMAGAAAGALGYLIGRETYGKPGWI